MLLLNKVEILTYLLIWISSICYALWNVYQFSYANRLRLVSYLTPSADVFVNHLPFRDGYQFEWDVFSQLFIECWFIHLLHFIAILSVKYHRLKDEVTCTVICMIGAFGTTHLLGVRGLLVILSQPILTIIILNVFKITSTLRIFIIFTLQSALQVKYPDFSLIHWMYDPVLESRSIYIATVLYAWVNLKCISFASDSITSYPSSDKNELFELNFFSYIFYWPGMYGGPHSNFHDFYKNVLKSRPKISLNLNFFKSVMFQTLRFGFWFLIVELSLHTLYFSAISNYSQGGESFADLNPRPNTWVLCGLAFGSGIFFQLTYVIFYGVPNALDILSTTSEDVVSMDSKSSEKGRYKVPICICRVYLYSEMWRSFDVGLHQFLKVYMYQPLISWLNELGVSSNKVSKMICGAIVFSFICIWHGQSLDILLWSVFNFISLIVENCLFHRKTGLFPISKWSSFKGKEMDNQRRLHCFLATPLFFFSLYSNAIFLMGLNSANLVLMHIWNSSAFSIFCLWTILYCGCQSSAEFTNLKTTSCKTLENCSTNSRKQQ